MLATLLNNEHSLTASNGLQTAQPLWHGTAREYALHHHYSPQKRPSLIAAAITKIAQPAQREATVA